MSERIVTKAGAWPRQSGSMAGRIRRHDWEGTSLGPIGTWPQPLRTAVDLMLDAQQPVYLAWGPELVSLYNDGFAPFLGDKHPEGLGRPYREVFAEVWEEYRPTVEATLGGEAQYFRDRAVPLAGRASRPMSWFTFSMTPLRDEAGAVAGFVTSATETTGKVLTEKELRDSEERLGAALEAARMASWFWDPVADTLIASDTYAALFGVPSEKAWESSARFYQLVHPEDRDAYQDLVETAGLKGRSWETEFRVVRPSDGSIAWLEERANPVRDPVTGDVMITGLVWDVTERRAAEGALKKSESNARLLLSELQHRVRNTLSVIRSIARRTAETSDSVEDFHMHLDGRIGAFARVQASVTRDPTRGVDLATLIADELAAATAHEGRQVTLAGPEVRLPAKTAETLGLTFHELATNAVKHGALATRQGCIHVAWALAPGEPPELFLEWKETGVAMPETTPARRGFGTELLERLLPYQLGARAVQAFEPDGLRCTIELSLPA